MKEAEELTRQKELQLKFAEEKHRTKEAEANKKNREAEEATKQKELDLQIAEIN